MLIPHRSLSPEALRGLIEAFVAREGTDYGEVEMSLETKVLQVAAQLDQGKAFIVYNEEDETCSVLPKDQVPKAG